MPRSLARSRAEGVMIVPGATFSSPEIGTSASVMSCFTVYVPQAFLPVLVLLRIAIVPDHEVKDPHHGPRFYPRLRQSQRLRSRYLIGWTNFLTMPPTSTNAR